MAGQIIRRGDRAWLVRISLGRDATGKRRYHNRTIHGTKRDAETYRNRFLSDRDQGKHLVPTRMTLAEFLAEWVANITLRVRPKTAQDYREIVDRRLVPALGNRRLDRLERADVRLFFQSLAGAGLSSRTVRYVHSVLHNALNYAVEEGYIARNVAHGTALPGKTRREIRVLNQEEVKRLIAAARETRFGGLWILLVTSGLRPSEALALKWSDLDGCKLRVHRTIIRTKTGFHFGAPKTEKGNRTVVLPQGTVEVLRKHRLTQIEERLRHGEHYENTDLVFCTHLGKPIEWRVITQRYFRTILKLAALPCIRPYALRHSHATLLLKQGVHPKVVQERLGHAKISMTLDIYSHVFPDMQDEVAVGFELLVFGAHQTQAATTT